MLDWVNPKVREVLLDYDFIVKYLKGTVSIKVLRENLAIYKDEILSRNVPEDYIINLTNPDYELYRGAAYQRFAAYVRRIGLDITTFDDKIRGLKSISAGKFLDILSINAGFLEGFFGILKIGSRKEESIRVGAGKFIEIEPPDNSKVEFVRFFSIMQENISSNNLPIWAVKLYFAIICSHMFRDANGRIARNAYFMLRSNGLLSEELSSNRSQQISDANLILLQIVVVKMLGKEGITVNSYSDIRSGLKAKFVADEEDGNYPGLSNHLKFIACERVLKKIGAYKNETIIIFGEWDDKRKNEYYKEYRAVRQEWFWMCVKMSEVYYQRLGKLLDEGLGIKESSSRS